MMRRIVAEKIAAEIHEWGHKGLIGEDLQARLTHRYSTDVTLGRLFLNWLGFVALFMLGMSVLGFIGMALGDVARVLAPFVIGGIAWLLWRKGVDMATDPEQRLPTSGAVLVTGGLIGAFAAIVMLYDLTGGENYRYATPTIGIVVAGAAIFTAYRYGLRWPLALGVLQLFHALGNMHRYGGGGGYYLGVQDERLTFAVAVASVLFGMWHEKVREADLQTREVGFGQVFIVFGLLYANLSLWILSLPSDRLIAVLLFTAFGIAQLVIAGRLHDERFAGFGVVFLSINIYTRLFENFWDELSRGSFFLVAGILGMAIGSAFEYRARNVRPVSTQ